jgi:hypothetical protein
MPDPTAFLSTIAATSAAMVAIVGGLLVARFVSIASEQEGAERLLQDERNHLTTARRREQEARGSLLDWDVHDFFTTKVIQTIYEGERRVPELRKIGEYTPLTDKEIAEAAKTVLGEIERARQRLRQSIPTTAATNNYSKWEEYRHTHPLLPETDWDEVSGIAYEDIVRPPKPTFHQAYSGLSTIPAVIPFLHVPTPPEYVALGIQRRDALLTDVARAKQRVEDIEEELARLQRARDAIVRPKGLGGGLVVQCLTRWLTRLQGRSNSPAT